ncbi:MAG: response regulator transcription factor [Spirochaetales bacterium]|nr:response regulator transcription factor [Spirochaetales bacterium]
MSNEHILVVDDEKNILELITYNLEKEGYRTTKVVSGESALSEIQKNLPDLIILDLMLPGLDGIEICRRLKQDAKTKSIPILMVTAKSEDSDIILGLEMGADDYITKPFSPKVLLARIRAVLRRNAKVTDAPGARTLKIHDIEIDIPRHQVTFKGELIELSATEFSILEFLARNPGWVFSRNQIISSVKGTDYPVTERSVDVQILGLRKKLGEGGGYIETVRGIGYRMQEVS